MIKALGVSMKPNDVKHLRWLYERMIYVHNERADVDYMLKFDELIKELDVKNKIYLAAPFFNPDQAEKVDQVERLVRILGHDLFSPRLESSFEQGDDPSPVLKKNCNGIMYSDYIIAITDDKDVGTMWECGFAFAVGKPILYLWLGWTLEKKFNIMLAASGSVVHNYEELAIAINNFKMFSSFNVPTNSEMLHE